LTGTRFHAQPKKPTKAAQASTKTGLFQTGQMELEWAKNRHRRILPVVTAGLMGDPAGPIALV